LPSAVLSFRSWLRPQLRERLRHVPGRFLDPRHPRLDVGASSHIGQLGHAEIGEAVRGFARGQVERAVGNPRRCHLVLDLIDFVSRGAKRQQRHRPEDESRCRRSHRIYIEGLQSITISGAE
jgi:hypothetical protein